jgi:hypothetical protein
MPIDRTGTKPPTAKESIRTPSLALYSTAVTSQDNRTQLPNIIHQRRWQEETRPNEQKPLPNSHQKLLQSDENTTAAHIKQKLGRKI